MEGGGAGRFLSSTIFDSKCLILNSYKLAESKFSLLVNLIRIRLEFELFLSDSNLNFLEFKSDNFASVRIGPDLDSDVTDISTASLIYK